MAEESKQTTKKTSTSTTSSTITTIRDQKVMSEYNNGPVIESFTPPASCLSTLTFSTDMYFGHRRNAYFDPACYPEKSTNASGWDMYYYSPAQCPLGWAQVATLQHQEGKSAGGATIRFSLGDQTTAVVCCPSGFTYPVNGLGHQCHSELPRARSTLYYKSPSFNGEAYVRTGGSGSELLSYTYSVTTGEPYNIYGDGIPVWWQETDLKLFATPSLAATRTSTSDSNTPTTPSTPITTLPPFTPTSTPSTGGLSTGAKIGLGVGIPLVLLAIGIISFFFWHRRRKNYKVVTAAGAPQSQDGEANMTQQWNPTQGPVELQENKWHEPQRPTPVELHDTTASSPFEPYRRSELPAS